MTKGFFPNKSFCRPATHTQTFPVCSTQLHPSCGHGMLKLLCTSMYVDLQRRMQEKRQIKLAVSNVRVKGPRNKHQNRQHDKL